MARVTINGKDIPAINKMNHLLALGTRADEVDGGTMLNSALKPFDVKVDTIAMTATSDELSQVREWMASKNPEYIVHIEDEGESKRTREIALGTFVKKIDAALLAMPYVVKARELAKVADGGITKLDATESTGKGRGTSKSLSLDIDID